MRLEQSFEVPVPVAQAWGVLLDVERIAPCMPGATLTGFDGTAFSGNVKVKLGPVSLAYRGNGRFTERDEPGKRVVIVASGQDSRGAGGASARVAAVLHAANGGSATLVKVVVDLDIAGKAAQFGRGMIADVSGKLIKQFADCLAQKIASEAAPIGAAVPVDAQPFAPAPVVETPVVAPAAAVPEVIPVPEVVRVAPAPQVVSPVASASVEEYHPLAMQEPDAAGQPVAGTAQPVAEPVVEVQPEPAPAADPVPVAQPETAYAYEPDAPARRPAPLSRPAPEAEPIDLLALSGAKGMARRAAPVLIVVVLIAVAVIVWLAVM